MLDFVPNHMAPDHDWVATHPEYFIEGTEEDRAREPQNWGDSRRRMAGAFWLTDGILISLAGLIRCSSITAIQPAGGQ